MTKHQMTKEEFDSLQKLKRQFADMRRFDQGSGWAVGGTVTRELAPWQLLTESAPAEPAGTPPNRHDRRSLNAQARKNLRAAKRRIGRALVKLVKRRLP